MSKTKFQPKKRYGTEHTFKGQLFKKKSVTIPGQDYTPQELIRRYRSGIEMPNQYFTEHPVSSFDRMNTMEKIEYLTDLKTRNHQAKEALNIQINDLRKKAQLEELQRQVQQKKEDVQNHNANDATNVTNAN